MLTSVKGLLKYMTQGSKCSLMLVILFKRVGTIFLTEDKWM